MHRQGAASDRRALLSFCLFCSLGFTAAAFFVSPPAAVFSGFLRLLTHSASLTVDAFAVAGPGGAFFNASLLGFFPF